MKQDQNWNTNGITHDIPRLYVMCGAPGSGKSTWAKRHFPEHYYVSRDEIRFKLLQPGDDYFAHEHEVYDKFIAGIKLGLSFGDTIADATHLNLGSRRKLYNALSQEINFPYEIYWVFMDTPLAVCLKRNEQREGRAKVPERSITEMFGKMNIPTIGEHEKVKGVWIVRE